MTVNFYETDRAVAEYLLFHYGSPESVLPCGFGPTGALHYPVRCVTECLDAARLPVDARALDLGCAVGRSTFELARHCAQVVGIDFSQRFIDIARELQRHGRIDYAYADEGALTLSTSAIIPPDLDRQRIRFEQGDAQNLPAGLGRFDAVLLANLIDRLQNPRQCLHQVSALVQSGGQLIITSPYSWMTEYTPKENWLGGFERGGSFVRTFESLQEMLTPNFRLLSRQDLPFLIREHARKFQWSVAEATVWLRN